MAAETKEKKVPNALADAKNWEQRLITEQEAPHKWAEAWGSLFDNGIPHEYDARIKFLEEKVKAMPNSKPLPKYGCGGAFKEVNPTKHRRQKMFQDDIDLDE